MLTFIHWATPHSVTFTLFCLMKMLHHADAVPPPHNERRSSRPRRHWEDRDHQRPGPSPGHHGLRVQLLWADGLQGERVCVTHAWLWTSHLHGQASFFMIAFVSAPRDIRHQSWLCPLPPSTLPFSSLAFSSHICLLPPWEDELISSNFWLLFLCQALSKKAPSSQLALI